MAYVYVIIENVVLLKKVSISPVWSCLWLHSQNLFSNMSWYLRMQIRRKVQRMSEIIRSHNQDICSITKPNYVIVQSWKLWKDPQENGIFLKYSMQEVCESHVSLWNIFLELWLYLVCITLFNVFALGSVLISL